LVPVACVPSPKIAVVTALSGIVARGAERTADDFQRSLDGDVTVVSLAGSRAQNGSFPRLAEARELWATVTKRARLLDRFMPVVNRDKFRFLVGTYDFYSSAQWFDYILSRQLPAALDSLQPRVVIAMVGFHSHRVLSRYCRTDHIVYLGLYGGGPSNAMRLIARKLSQGIVVQTPFELKFLRRAEPRARVELIPLGIDIERYRPGNPDDSFPAELEQLERPIFFSASAFDPYKRLHLFVDAVSCLEHGSLVMAGDGRERNRVIERANQKLGPKRVRYLGVIDEERLIKFYQAADVYCLCSHREAFGNVLLEALACGKPIVTTDDETRRWIMQQAGLAVDVTNSQTFAAALQQAAATDWAARPRRRAEYFSLRSVAAEWNKLIAARLSGTDTYVSAYELDLARRQPNLTNRKER
jgi:glycosyltransferase involved in cell wall biosynthesis